MCLRIFSEDPPFSEVFWYILPPLRGGGWTCVLVGQIWGRYFLLTELCVRVPIYLRLDSAWVVTWSQFLIVMLLVDSVAVVCCRLWSVDLVLGELLSLPRREVESRLSATVVWSWTVS